MSKLVEEANISKAVQKVIEDLEPYMYYDEVITAYFGGQVEIENKEEEEKKKRERELIVDSTIKDLIILGKEEAMTSSKALLSIENHVKNDKLLNFQQKQD